MTPASPPESIALSGMRRWGLAVVVLIAVRASAEPAASDGPALYQARRYREAGAVFQQLAAVHPDNAEAVYYLGKIAVQQENYAEAVQFLERAVALAPERSDYHLWLGNAYAWAASTAPYCDKAGLGRKCLGAYRTALALNPDNLQAHFSLMNFYRHVPAFLGGGLSHAYDEAAAIRERDAAFGAYALAVLCMHEKKYPQAFTALEKVLRQRPADFAANCALGRLALETGTHLAFGETCLRRCLGLCPTENDESLEKVQWYLGQIAEIQRQAPDARQAYEACLKLNPHFKPAEEALARLR
jgi:tetratricopeptide (TPR) repeat protein